jgi:hypothetical protein
MTRVSQYQLNLRAEHPLFTEKLSASTCTDVICIGKGKVVPVLN